MSMISARRSRFARCSTTLTVKAKSSSFTHAAARCLASQLRVPAIRSALSLSASWKEIWTWSSPASLSRSARSRVRPRAEVTSVWYSPAPRAWSTSSSRSRRTSGSPPESPSWSTPRARASVNTRFQSPVVSSAAERARSSGLEQYGQCSGQRCVSSASRVVGLGDIAHQLALRELPQVLEHVALHVRAVFLAERGGYVGHRAPAVAEAEDLAGGVAQEERALRVEEHGAPAHRVEVHPRELPEGRARDVAERHGATPRGRRCGSRR